MLTVSFAIGIYMLPPASPKPPATVFPRSLTTSASPIARRTVPLLLSFRCLLTPYPPPRVQVPWVRFFKIRKKHRAHKIHPLLRHLLRKYSCLTARPAANN